MQQEQHQQHQISGLSFKELKRNICACDHCRSNCKIIPGYTVKEDIINIYNYYNPVISFTQFCELFFLASPGAIVITNGELKRIFTIVPARSKNGYCIFLTPNERCSIHDIAPFGCRYFDCKQTKEEADRISGIGLYDISNDTQYISIWMMLYEKNLRSLAPEELRKKFNEKGMG